MSRLLHPLLFLFCLCFSQIASVYSSWANELNEQGMTFFNQQNFRQAIVKYQQAIDNAVMEGLSREQIVKIEYNLAKSYYLDGQHQKAMKQVDNILSDFPKHFKARFLKARYLRKLDDKKHLQKALDLFDQLKAESSGDKKQEIDTIMFEIRDRLKELQNLRGSGSGSASVDRLTQAGTKLYEAGKCSKAILRFEDALVKADQYKLPISKVNDILYKKAKAFRCTENYNSAIQLLERILRSDKSNSKARDLKEACQRDRLYADKSQSKKQSEEKGDELESEEVPKGSFRKWFFRLFH